MAMVGGPTMHVSGFSERRAYTLRLQASGEP